MMSNASDMIQRVEFDTRCLALILMDPGRQCLTEALSSLPHSHYYSPTLRTENLGFVSMDHFWLGQLVT
jgi:hypothetical protein